MTTKTSKRATQATDTNATAHAAVAHVDRTRNLEVVREPGKSEDRMYADLVTDGLVSNASTAIRFNTSDRRDVSLTDLVASLREQGEAVNRGNLAAAERMLSAQAVALNAVFSEMARVAQMNMFKAPEFADRYLRLALKAQSQSRATVETLAAIKNPPMVFAWQANINNGGQQQVNNGSAPPMAGPPSPALKSATGPSKLLEASNGERVDFGTKGAAGRANPCLATVGAVHRTKERGR